MFRLLQLLGPMLRALLILPFLSGLAFAAEPVYPAGSRIGLVPPEGMVLARGLSGFADPNNGTTIVVIEMPRESYARTVGEFSDENLKAQGFTSRTRDDVQLGPVKGLLVSGEQAEGSRAVPKAVLVASDDTMAALVIGQLPVGAPAADEDKLRATLKTVSFRPPLAMEEQLGALPFSIGDRGGFRPLRVMAGNAVLFTDGPSDTIAEANQPMLIVAHSFGSPPPLDQRGSFARSALVANTLLTDPVIERSQEFKQGGAEWHEIVARAKDGPSGRDVVAVQTIRFEPGGYLRTVGVVRAEQRDEMLPRFRRVADSAAPR